jgi:hypothetical protein
MLDMLISIIKIGTVINYERLIMCNYYTLLVKYESKDEPWSIAFGDYDKETVHQEKVDAYDDAKDTKIICTEDSQSSINEAVELLNKGSK